MFLRLCKALQTNGGMIFVASAGLLLSLLLSVVVVICLPSADKLFILMSNTCIGFQSSLFTILQLKRREASPSSKSSSTPTAE